MLYSGFVIYLFISNVIIIITMSVIPTKNQPQDMNTRSICNTVAITCDIFATRLNYDVIYSSRASPT